jgi:tryptophan synthase alpha chain
MNRIDAAFVALRQKRLRAFIPFITAGDPSFEVTRDLVLEAARSGADLIEFGIPFSDPIADGPVIQASYTRALARGATVAQAFRTVREVRRQSEVPLVFMISHTLVFRMGTEAFIKAACEAGVDGAIIPDLPLEEGEAVAGLGRANNFHIIFLIAPTTPPDRRRRIAEISQGFIYCVAVTGITGVRDRLPDDLVEHVASIKRLTQKPVCLGFGVSTPEQARFVAAHADGVIVGSAIVREIERAGDLPPRELVARVGGLIRRLAAATKEMDPDRAVPGRPTQKP